MAEYIEREALTAKFKQMELGKHGLAERLFADGVYAVIAEFPAADVEPVVRCKDCECWHTTECALDYAMFEPTEFSFCSYGKRKDGADHAAD